MCIVTITLPVQIKVNERSCVLLPGSVMVTIHMTAHLSGFVQIV
jgi:hypothetical protein